MYQPRRVLASGNGQGHSGILLYLFQHIISLESIARFFFSSDIWSNSMSGWLGNITAIFLLFFLRFVLMMNVCPLGSDDPIHFLWAWSSLLVWCLWLNTWVPCLCRNCLITNWNDILRTSSIVALIQGKCIYKYLFYLQALGLGACKDLKKHWWQFRCLFFPCCNVDRYLFSCLWGYLCMKRLFTDILYSPIICSRPLRPCCIVAYPSTIFDPSDHCGLSNSVLYSVARLIENSNHPQLGARW